jgi:hypothetical protein
MWTYLLGPFLSFFPQRWRRKAAGNELVDWGRAAAVSGFLEALMAIISLAYWYSYSVSTWVSRGLDAALSGKVSATDHEIGLMALSLFAMHPLTWLLFFFALEGAVRLCAGAFTGTALGTVPLLLISKVIGLFTSQRGDREFAQSNASSYWQAVRDRFLSSGGELQDALLFSEDGKEQRLEIRAGRAKADWQPPRVVRYEDHYYRLEESRRGMPPRIFVYRLTRLAAGVPGRTVIVYAPEEPIVVRSAKG